jgi:hypothetical protein
MNTFIKPYITPEKSARQKRIFDVNRWGNLKFFIVVSYRKTNVFFSFYCKAEKVPSRVILFYQRSLGLEKRDAIRLGTSPKVTQRGRLKSQLYRINLKFNMLKAYVTEFIKTHPIFLLSNCIHVVWKIHTFDANIHSILTQPFDLSVDASFKMKESQAEIDSKLQEEILKRKKLMEEKYMSFEEKQEKGLIKLAEVKQLAKKLSGKGVLITPDLKLTDKQFLSLKYNIGIFHHINLKLPHNGCRPKKVRRTKKSRRK